MKCSPSRHASEVLIWLGNSFGNRLACRLVPPLACAVALIGCGPGEPTAYVEYRHAGAVDSAPLEVYLYAGLDRDWDPQFKPGEVGQARLRPGRSVVLADERQLWVKFFRMGELPGEPSVEPYYWYGPDLPPDKSYRVRIDLYPDGRVDSEHCVLPCSLPDR